MIISDVKSGSVLFGCSKKKHRNKRWNVSTTMMQTYLAMKGPGADMDDPLVKWIDKQEVEKRQEGESTWVHHQLAPLTRLPPD